MFEDIWSCLTDDHKMLSQTGSFTIGRDMYDKPIDVKQLETPQSVLHVLHDQSRRDGKYRRRRHDVEEVYADADDNDDLHMIQLCVQNYWSFYPHRYPKGQEKQRGLCN